MPSISSAAFWRLLDAIVMWCYGTVTYAETYSSMFS